MAATNSYEIPLPKLRYIKFKVENSVARLTLDNKPYNLLTVAMMREIAIVLESLTGRGDVKCVVMDSAQPVFSSGISREDSKAERIFQTLDAFNSVFQAIVNCSKPLIVAVDGQAIGTGCELVAFGDLIIATPRAQFAQPEVRLGVFPPFASVMLPAVVGPKRAYEMILTGQPMSGVEARERGFVNRLVPENELQSSIEEVVARIVQFSGPVLEMTKMVIASSQGLPLEKALKRSQDVYLNQLMLLEDAQEGVRAVFENRRPVWRNK